MNDFRDAFNSLLSRPLRSALALTGILVGTAAVVAMTAGGQLASEAVLSQFRAAGTDLLDVSILPMPEKIGKKSASPIRRLTEQNITGLLQGFPAITAIAPWSLSSSTLHHHGQRLQASLLGVTPAFFSVLGLHVQNGRLLSPFDGHTSFCVIGRTVAEQISRYSAESPIGQFIHTGKTLCKVIGTLQKWPDNIFLSVTPDRAVLMPLQTVMINNPSATLQNAILKVADNSDIGLTGNTLEVRLQRLLPDRQIFVRSPTSLIERIRRQSDILTLYLGLAGGITLFVGGIGIMNMMLVSVMERRREIGIRLALGAKRRQIRGLFLAEAILLSLAGGLPGILLGLIAARITAYLLHWPFEIMLLPPLTGFTVTVLTGILAGLWPAVHAAKLTPAAALRSE